MGDESVTASSSSGANQRASASSLASMVSASFYASMAKPIISDAGSGHDCDPK
jgi:hypothetical protein